MSRRIIHYRPVAAIDSPSRRRNYRFNQFDKLWSKVRRPCDNSWGYSDCHPLPDRSLPSTRSTSRWNLLRKHAALCHCRNSRRLCALFHNRSPFWNSPFDSIANGLQSQPHLLSQIRQQRAGVATRMAGHFQINIDEPKHLRYVITSPSRRGFRAQRVARIGSNRAQRSRSSAAAGSAALSPDVNKPDTQAMAIMRANIGRSPFL